MATATTPKTYVYHIYKNTIFKGVLTNVISDFAYQQEINSAGSAVTIVLGAAADSFGEGTLIDFNNNVQVYEIDDANPNGKLVWQGFIANYKPVFTDTNQEQVILTVMGYGATLAQYMIESGELADVTQTSQQTDYQWIYNNGTQEQRVWQSWTSGSGITRLSAISVRLDQEYNVFSPPPPGTTTVILEVFTSQADAENSGSPNVIGTTTLGISSSSPGVYKFTFATPLVITAATTYYFRLRVQSDVNFDIGVYYDNTGPYSGGLARKSSTTNVWSDLGGDLYFVTYSSQGSTTAAYNSQDPSVILKALIDNYNNQGGQVTYTPSSIDLTGTTVSYQFNTNTVLDGVNKCLTLAPIGWYWYVDQATNVLHFHKQSATANHTLTLGKNIKNLSIEKRAQDIVNVVYFVGGPTAGVNLFQKYVLQSSVDLYGRHALLYTDNNVTLAATAQIIANSILTNQAQIELRIDLEIMDDGGNASSALGFDIESIVLGESVNFRSFGPGTGGSLWDVALWDVAKWDFDITDLSSIIIQVTKVDYSPDVLHLSMSTVPPDITKRVQDIYRNLQQVNVLNNPATPS